MAVVRSLRGYTHPGVQIFFGSFLGSALSSENGLHPVAGLFERLNLRCRYLPPRAACPSSKIKEKRESFWAPVCTPKNLRPKSVNRLGLFVNSNHLLRVNFPLEPSSLTTFEPREIVRAITSEGRLRRPPKPSEPRNDSSSLKSRALPCRASKQTLAHLARHFQARPLETLSYKRDLPPVHYLLKVDSYTSLASGLPSKKYDTSVFEAGGYKW
ncbi:hypothetical protein FNV43_RR15168 [Rhamnella rubrinervis]|uniref:MATH domain-containing protein n=1 Tax=Rhamnella rubrinervis TaxID=2594499 RepID=A0A8K0E8H1_9ROSA|nr:hypothetical protein FNV43_RR15168 [Rhamnella rubrinervis]